MPNLLRKPKALPYTEVLVGLRHVRSVFKDKSIHVFGVGGTATIHLTALLGFDSADSSGWRNRAARGIVQLPGCGERLVADLGSWRGRQPSTREWLTLDKCLCPACRTYGVKGLKANMLHGFPAAQRTTCGSCWKKTPGSSSRLGTRRMMPIIAQESITRPIVRSLMSFLGRFAADYPSVNGAGT